MPSEKDLHRAGELHQQGVEAGDEGQLNRAAELFEAALSTLGLDTRGEPTNPGTGALGPAPEAVERDRLAARILTSLALPAYELGQVDAGLATIEAAERVATRARYSGARVLVAVQHGLLLIRAGRPAEAMPYLDRAVRLLRYAAPVEQVKILMNRGDAHHQLGHTRQARVDFVAARDLARQHQLSEFDFRNTHNAAFMDYLAGNLPQALQSMPSPADATSDYARGVVAMDRSKVLLAAGLVTEADETLQLACDALARTDLVQLLAEAELARAEAALLADRYDLARELSRLAARRFRRRHNERWTALAELVTLQSEAARRSASATTPARARRIAARLDRHGLTDKARVARLIAAELDLQGPRPPRVPVLPTARRGEPIAVRLHVRSVRAQILYGRGDARGGRREVRVGLDELSAYQSGFGSFDLQTSSATHGVGLAVLGIQEAIRAERPAVVFQLLERGRAISSRVAPVLPPDDERTAELLTQLRWLASTMDEQEAAGKVDDRLRRRRAQLERDIQASSWTREGPHRVQDIVDLPTLQAGLSSGAVVALFLLHRRVHGLVVTESGCRMHFLTDLGPVEELSRRINADLDVLALDGLPEPLRATVRRSFLRDVNALDALLLAPLVPADGPVVLLPPARLAALPWGQLPSLQGRPLTLAASGSSWLAARQRLRPGSGHVVAIAGPGLARAQHEVAGVSASWPSAQQLVGADATGPAVLSAIDGADLVHIAAHGRHQRDSPLFSSINLADGPVVGYDLDRLRQPPQTAVLSACELGQATARPGDEALGLTRALLHSGTSTVISGVAKVSDAGAAALMIDYHQRLAHGRPPAVALAASLQAAPEPVPFVCFGAGW